MYNDELIHAAVDIINRRNERLELEDELYHYGRKGMKWGKNIFEQDEKNSKNKKSNPIDPYARAYKFAESKFGPKAARNAAARYAGEQAKGYIGDKINGAASKVTDNPYAKAYRFAESKFGPKVAQKAATKYAGEQAKNYIGDKIDSAASKVTDNPYAKAYDIAESKFGSKTAQKAATKYATEQAENKVKETGENIKQHAAEKKEILDTKINDLKEGARETGQKIKEGAQEAGQKIKEGASAAGEKISETGQKIKEGASEAGQKIKEGATETGDKLKNFLGIGKNKAESFSDIEGDARNNATKKLNKGNYAGRMAVSMLGGDEETVMQLANEMDKIINEEVDNMVKSAGLSYDDPATDQAAYNLKQQISQQYIDMFNTQYAALLQQQQQEIINQQQEVINQQMTPNPATQPWLFGIN